MASVMAPPSVGLMIVLPGYFECYIKIDYSRLSISPLPLSPTSLCLPTILAMNAFPNGTRIFFWGANGDIKYGTVQSTSHMVDGTQVLVIKEDGGNTTSLPAAGVSKVT